MVKFTYVSARGEQLPLIDAENYVVTNIDGQTAAATDISSVVVGGVDGDTVNNVQAQPRTIIIDIRIKKDVELTKRQILNVVKLKQQGTLQWQQDGRLLEIKGVVEAIDMPRWAESTTIQITLHCAQPFWENIDYIVSKISETIDLHCFTDYRNDMLYFPETGIPLSVYNTIRTREIHNAGDVAVGMLIEITALDTVTNPIIRSDNGKFFGCGYGTGNKRVVMAAGDVIKINTRKNEKSVTLNGVSILGKVKPLSTWLQLEAGDNTFAVNSDDETRDNMIFNFVYKQRYI